MRKRSILFAVLSLVLSLTAHLAAQTPAKVGRVLDPQTGNAFSLAAVLIGRDKIKQVGSASQLDFPDGTPIIDLDIAPLLASLIDGQMHLFPDIVGVPAASQQSTQQSVSVARMRVPRKARELYEKATKPFLKHDYIKAQRKLDQALHLYAAFPEALTMQGFIQIDLNKWEAAEQSLQTAVRSDATYGEAYFLLSYLYNRQQRFDDALAMSRRAVQLIPNAWLAYYEMCQAFMGKDQFVQAVSISDAALSTNRGTLLHVAKAHALIGLGRYQEAVVELQTYLRYQPAGEGSQDAHDLLDRIQSGTALVLLKPQKSPTSQLPETHCRHSLPSS